MSYNSHNVGHLMFDELYPWFTLQEMLGLAGSDIQPLNFVNFNPKYPHHDMMGKWSTREAMGHMPTNSCARYAYAVQSKMTYRWEAEGKPLPADELKNAQNILRVCEVLRKKLVPAVTSHPIRTFPDVDTHPELGPGKMVCFPRVVAGIGMATEHCGDESRHGDLPEKNGNWCWDRTVGDVISGTSGRQSLVRKMQRLAIRSLYTTKSAASSTRPLQSTGKRTSTCLTSLHEIGTLPVWARRLQGSCTFTAVLWTTTSKPFSTVAPSQL